MYEAGETSEHIAVAQGMLQRLQLVIALASFSTFVITAGLPIYSTEIGATGLEVGELFAAGALMTAIARPIIGRALDLYGRKPFLLLGMAILAISMILFALSRDVVMLLIASTMQGLGLGTMLLSAYAMTADLTMVGGRAGSFGSTEQSQYRGGLYGGLLAIPVLLLTGFNPQGQLRVTPTAWTILFLLYAVMGGVAYVVALKGIRETYSVVVRHEAQSGTNPPQKIHPQLYVLMAIVALTSASSSGIAPFILKYIQDHITQDVSMIALAYLPASIAWGFLPSKMGVIADRFGRKLPMAIGLIVSGIFSAFIPFLTMIFPLMLFATMEAVCYSAAVPAEQALVADMTGGKQRGMGFGLYTLGMSAGRVVGPLIMGWLYDQFRSGPFFANAVILLIGTLLVLFLLRDPSKSRAKESFTS
jgi:MFS transporter, DHA1 family, multidrug resistance protein